MDQKKWEKYLGPELFVGGDKSQGVGYETRISLSVKVLIHVSPDHRRVLVVGCGEGAEVRWLVERGFEARGITRSRREKELGQSQYGVMIDHGDMHELPYPDASYDCVFAKDVYEHALSPFIAMNEFKRVLRPGGRLIVTMPSSEWGDEFYHYNMMTHSQMYSMLRKCGFNVLAGPGMRPLIRLAGRLVIALGFRRGHIDVYIAARSTGRNSEYMMDVEEIYRRPVFGRLKRGYDHCPLWLRRWMKRFYDEFFYLLARCHRD